MKNNQQIDALRTRIFQVLDSREVLGLPLTTEIAKSIIEEHLNHPISTGLSIRLMSFIEKNLETILDGKKRLSPQTIIQYRSLNRHMQDFLMDENKIDIDLNSVNQSFIKDFDNYLTERIRTRYGRTVNRNTIYKYHSMFKALLNTATHNESISHNPYQHFKLKKPVYNYDWLTEQEIIKITGLALGNQSMELSRDYLLFSLWTGGMRYSDLEIIRTGNVIQEAGYYFLHIKQKKTNKSVCIPMLPGAVAIFKKHKSNQEETGFILPRLAQQKFNVYLKSLGNLAGVQKWMKLSIARHSAGVTIYSKTGVPRHLIDTWLGHLSQMTTIDNYPQITKEELFFWVKKLNELFDKPEFLPK